MTKQQKKRCNKKCISGYVLISGTSFALELLIKLLEEGDYVVCYYGGQNKPDSFYFITKEEAEKILETGEW